MQTARHWDELSAQLEAVLSALESTRAAALAGVADGDPDAFARQCGALADAMAALARQTARPPSTEPMPAAVRAQVERVQAALDGLHEQTARLSASTQRALSLLFPADPLKAYGRLGGRGPSLGGSGYLKA